MKLTQLARSLAVATALTAGCLAGSAVASTPSALVAEATDRYYVIFNEAGAFRYQGEDSRFAATASPRSGVKFDARRPEVDAYRAHLSSLQAQRIADFEQLLGRSLSVPYQYDVLFNGIVIENLSAADAAKLAAQASVATVEPVIDYELATDSGPAYVGADAIWSGAATPDGSSYRGEGMVIGVFDSGLNLTAHASFSNDASCGLDAGTPKVIAAKDCINSGTCSGATPTDVNGHGTHVAATVAGNTHLATGGALSGFEVSGVAPCAQMITYKVCPGQSCDGAAITAAMNTSLLDGIDAVNYSISGGTSPWTDADRRFLDLIDAGIFVAAASGNTNQTITNPIGTVNHRGPWVMTVANSTHDRISSNAVSVAGGPQDVYGLKSDAAFPATINGQIADAAALGNALGCNPGFAAGSMSGRIALISRGDCTFVDKINNAQAAGAIGAIIFNNLPGQPPIPMGGTAATNIPAVMVLNADGLAIQSFVAGNPSAIATVDSTTVVTNDPAAGSILAAGSLRGPMPTSIEVTKPDITAPGTNIFAADVPNANSYGFKSGTSMASPHVAGGGLLVKGLHPDWSVVEVKSALQLTADKNGFKDFVNGTPNSGPWDADDVGNGKMDLSKAALAGLVLDESFTNFLNANGNQTNQRALNLPSMRNTSCTPSCTWTRTVRNTLDTASSWTATGANFGPGLSVSVSPSSFSFTGNTSETQVLTITATPNGDQTGAVIFGEVNLVEAAELSPDLRMTVAIRGQGAGGPPSIQVDPVSISASGTAGAATPVTRPMNIINAGGSDLVWSEAPLRFNRGSAQVIWDQPQDGTSGIVSSFSVAQSGGAYTAGQFSLTADSELTEILVFGFDNSNTLPAQSTITWVIYPDVGDEPSGNPQTNPGSEVWTFSTAPTGAGVSIDGSGVITLNLVSAGENVELDPGTYWLSVYPTYAGTISGTGDPRWAWFQANPVGTGSKLIAPNLFGNITAWTLTGTGGLGTAIDDVAFRLSGFQGAVECGAPWLSISPTGGTVVAGGTGNVTVSMSAASLAEGVYNANICIDSNDPVNDQVVVPVSFTVDAGSSKGDADLALSMLGLPDTVSPGDSLTFLANAANFGPDSATGLTVDIELPAELSFSSHATRLTDKLAVQGGSWACAPDGVTLSCVFSGVVDSNALAPTLEVNTSVSTSALQGTISTTGTVSSDQDDPDTSNNSATVMTTVDGPKDSIFANGFECVSDCGDPDLVVIDNLNFVPAANFTGGSIQWVDGATCECDIAPFNLNVYGTATTLQFFWPNNANGSEGGVTLDTTTYAVLDSGATIGPDATFLVATAVAATAAWSVPGNADGYLGFRFLDNGITKYGYAHVTTGANGRPFTLNTIVYNDAGNAVTIP